MFFVILLIIGIIALIATVSAFLDNEIGIGLFTTVTLVIIIVSMCSMYNNKKNRFNELEYIDKIDYSQEIYAVKDNIDDEGIIVGGLFYTAGYIDDELYYYCISERDGGKYICKFPAANTTIYECENYFRVECWSKSKMLKGTFWMPRFDSYEIRYKLYVPTGTMTTEFNINLE